MSGSGWGGVREAGTWVWLGWSERGGCLGLKLRSRGVCAIVALSGLTELE